MREGQGETSDTMWAAAGCMGVCVFAHAHAHEPVCRDGPD